ncbi:MAG TPA: hypothetical protein IAC03_01960 [Candidatus Coprenecus pullistercoris]|nr:hypothetical protein [Candidatus Coprenecus pullistercoris]
MKSRTEKAALELLTKEDERYRLTRMGFIQDVSLESARLASKFPRADGETFSEWKTRCLSGYYRDRGFKTFCGSHAGGSEFKEAVLRLFRMCLKAVSATAERTLTDRYLAPDNDTVSYAMPDSLFEDIYSRSLAPRIPFESPSAMESACLGIAKERFPEEEKEIIRRMQDNERLYWEKFYIKLRPVTAAVCYQISGISGDSNTHDIWSDTCMSVNRAVVDRRLKEPVDAKAVISYSVGVLKNKNKELLRLKARTPADIDTLQYRLTEDDEEKYFNNPVTSPSNFPSQNADLSTYIDFTDKDSVQGYFIVILYNKEHPLHDGLIKGYEDKVERMFEHYIDGLSYEEIVARHYGIREGKEAARQCARLRQEIKRLKKSLWDRFNKMTEQYR